MIRTDIRNAIGTIVTERNLIIFLFIICIIPFINKAFHIDDVLFLKSADHIIHNPFDFYGFNVNWCGFEQPMYLVNQNPPLVSYYIAFVKLLFSTNKESIIHIAFILISIWLCSGIYHLAKLFCPYPLPATLISVFTPVFLISSTNVMCDLLMVAFYVWAIVTWVYGLERKKKRYLLYSSFLMSLAILTKYFALSVIPLLIVYSIVEERKIAKPLLFFCIPVFITILYQVLTYNLYGQNLLLNAATYAANSKPMNIEDWVKKILAGFSFMGGCGISILFYVSFLWQKRNLLTGTATIIFSLIFLYLLVDILQLKTTNFTFLLFVQFFLFVLVGINIIILSVLDLLNNRDSKAVMLFLLVTGVFVFSSIINWTVSARNFLPMIPVLGIIAVRRMDTLKIHSIKKNYTKYASLIIPSLLISFTVTLADASLANCQKKAANEIMAVYKNEKRQVWFQGHWGFQYYMESLGAIPLDYGNPKLKNGDIVVLPLNNTSLQQLSDDYFNLIRTIEIMPFKWAATMSEEANSGFYSDVWGDLPYSFFHVAPERYLVYLVH